MFIAPSGDIYICNYCGNTSPDKYSMLLIDYESNFETPSNTALKTYLCVFDKSTPDTFTAYLIRRDNGEGLLINEVQFFSGNTFTYPNIYNIIDNARENHINIYLQGTTGWGLVQCNGKEPGNETNLILFYSGNNTSYLNIYKAIITPEDQVTITRHNLNFT